MADYFASIFGTEKDKTILLQNLYENPRNSSKGNGEYITDEEDQRHFDEFFEDIYVELEEKYGPIEEMNVCDNLGDHLIGNVYVKFRGEEDAERAVNQLNERWFGGKPVYAELSTVTDFREAGCRQYEIGACTRGGFCNFMHLKQISDDLKRHLFGSVGNSLTHRSSRRSNRTHESRSRSRSRSVSITRHRSSRRHRHRSHKSSRKSPHRSPRYKSPTRSRSRSPRQRSPRSTDRTSSPRAHARRASSSKTPPRGQSPHSATPPALESSQA